MMKKVFAFLFFICIAFVLSAQTTFISGPVVGSQRFGATVIVLPNGNYVVKDGKYAFGPFGQDVGAVYLYNGSNHTVISTLTGNLPGDKIGNGGIIVLSNSNFLVSSPSWQDPLTEYFNVGAVTFVNGTTGLNGSVNASNSLVGSQANDNVGADGITVLSNNNYVVRSQTWRNGNKQNAGALTWGSGTTGINGNVSSSNSLVGSSVDDAVGSLPITQLTNGNYVVCSPGWNSTSATDVGAVTWCNGTTGRSGTISTSNSLVGSTPFDQVGRNPFLPSSNELGITPLANGNYVVSSPIWDNGGAIDYAGAVTWGNGTTGVSGEVNSSNSLVGSRAGDVIGVSITPLTNGNYVVNSYYWANGIFEGAGAATWANGTTGITGEINSSNSLVGTQQNDWVAEVTTALPNGNYVVYSSDWANGSFTNAGAATWGNGTTGISGLVSSTNSLVGTRINDRIGLDYVPVTVLPNGNYVIVSQYWANGAADSAGAVTWANGNTGISGTISSSNSLVGTKLNDRVGSGSIKVLSNGNYIVRSSYWRNGTATLAGAVTWANGSTGITGSVSSANSLVGNKSGDYIGSNGITELKNGNYLVSSPSWGYGAVTGAGAVTWGNGTTGIKGIVSNTNSLVGSHNDDFVGYSGSGSVNMYNGAVALANGNYVVNSKYWDNGGIIDAGASTWGDGNSGVTGLITTTNSIVGTSTEDFVGYKTMPLPNGNYIIHSPLWNNAAVNKAGAVTWANGTTGIIGTVSVANSLIGTTVNDHMGVTSLNSLENGITILSNGNYMIQSRLWDNGAIIDAGAVTFGNGSTGVKGTVNSCNSVLADVNTTPQFPFVVAYNTTYNYMLVGRSLQNIVNIYNPSGMALGINLDNVTQNVTGNSPTAFVVSNGCRIVASVLPTGITNPVGGFIEAKVWVQTSQPAAYVKRHYQITPDDNAETATGKVTLYFTQQEFTDFNAVNTIKLPINAADTANNKANIFIEKRNGISSNGTGLPASYPTATAPITINPADADIFYNSTFARWEVSFDVTGFSGFFLKNTAAINPITYVFNGNGSWNTPSNWLGGYLPPANLTAPNEILIDPINTGECVLQLNTAQIISNGAKITIAGTKKFRVEGNLIIQQ